MFLLDAYLKKAPFLVLDGAFSTELASLGFPLDRKLWSASAIYRDPAGVKKVHRLYLEAGADIIETSSYQASFEGFGEKGFTVEESRELFYLSVALARQAVSEWLDSHDEAGRLFPLVAASVGPYGAFLADGSEYRGHYGLTEKELYAFHRPRIEALAAGRPDLFACETIPSLEEALVEAGILEELGLEGWISFTSRDGKHISEGTDMSLCARELDGIEAVRAIGVNCSAPEYIAPLIGEIRKSTDKPVIVYPDSGEVYSAAEKKYEGPKEDLASFVPKWRALGVRIIGGCCRTTPAMIRAVAEERKKEESQ